MINIEKDPAEQFVQPVDFVATIPAGATITAHSVTAYDLKTSQVDTSVVGSNPVVGTAVNVFVQAGKNGHDYKFITSITCSDGSVWKCGFIIEVRSL